MYAPPKRETKPCQDYEIKLAQQMIGENPAEKPEIEHEHVSSTTPWSYKQKREAPAQDDLEIQQYQTEDGHQHQQSSEHRARE
jgi:hypothetical protein